MKNLTILSFGAGQDSTTLLYLYIHDLHFRNKYASGDFLVLMSDTGNEHDGTYKHIEETKKLCVDNNIEFVLLKPAMGYHGNNWSTLVEQYETHTTIGSKAYPKTCTDRLKITPIYNYVEDWIAAKYDLQKGRKKAFKEYATKYGKINMLIGIAKGEETRKADPEKEKRVWYKKAINVVYPLIDLELDRKGCQDKIISLGYKVPMPSNCRFCPWLSEQELLWLYRFDKDGFEFWERLEQNKLEANIHMNEKNLGVWGKYNKKENRPFTLRDALEVAKDKYNHLSDDDLNEYKMSHGHCVSSKY